MKNLAPAMGFLIRFYDDSL